MLTQCSACGTQVDESQSCPRCNGSGPSASKSAMLIAPLGVSFVGGSCDSIQNMITPQTVYGPPPMEEFDVSREPIPEEGSAETSPADGDGTPAAEGSGEPAVDGSADGAKDEAAAVEPADVKP